MKNELGVLFVGAKGHLAGTAIAGAALIGGDRAAAAGLVTAMEPFSDLALPGLDRMVFGGWDIRSADFEATVRAILDELRIPSDTLTPDAMSRIDRAGKNILPGVLSNCGSAIASLSDREDECPALSTVIAGLKDDIARFRDTNRLDRVVVVNVASTEPPLPPVSGERDLAWLETVIRENDLPALRPGALYAYAALDSGCPYINFTPSEGALFPALVSLAEKRGVPLMGSDGKTGETLVKSALAPMFAYRNLNVLSWEGYNILGNMDGKVLSNPDNKACKINSKDGVLSKILGYHPHSRVSIDFVPSLGDWKTAWDFIHFEGFLGTRMSLQFTWQGCDSALAAPLVLDLVRMAAFAHENGEAGLMPHLASFFKSPYGVGTYNLHGQYAMLLQYAAAHLEKAHVRK